MGYLDNRYVKVFAYGGYNICTLKNAIPEQGDDLSYIIDSDKYKGKAYASIAQAIEAIACG